MICDATLIFQLSTARSALPVQGASVLVTDPITGRNTRLTTDQSGRTHVLCVTAPPLSWSQSPGNDGRPYSIYHADIRAEGYVPVRLTGIQVFAGQQSLQTVEMVPCEGGKSMTNTPEETIGEPGDPLKSEQPGRFAQSPQEDDQPPGSLRGRSRAGRPAGEAADTAKPVCPPFRRAACGPNQPPPRICPKRSHLPPIWRLCPMRGSWPCPALSRFWRQPGRTMRVIMTMSSPPRLSPATWRKRAATPAPPRR